MVFVSLKELQIMDSEKMQGRVSEGHARCYIPKRYILTLLGFLGMFNVYAMRVNLSVAIVAMVNDTGIQYDNETHQAAACPELVSYEPQKNADEYKGEQYNWDSKAQANILGSFFYGYFLTQLPGGIFAEKIGAKWLFGGGILITAVFSLLTPFAASLGTGFFIAVRVLEGFGEGVTFPAINAAISHWSPKVERSRISTIIFTGCQIGNVISMPISGWLCSTALLGGWPSVFYIFGTIGCIWFVFWCFLIHETPAQHPTISHEELLYINQNKDDKPEKRPDIPWKDIFTSLPMWALIITHFGHNFGFLILLTEMPTYLSGILHFNIKADGFLSALPYIVQALTAWVVSYVVDRIRKSGKMNITTIRKISNSIGLFGPAVCLLCITLSGCRPYLIVGLLSLALALNGFVYSGFNVTHIDMSPDFAGTLFGITNAISNVNGILGPIIVGLFLQNGVTVANWNSVFYITAAVYVVSAVIFDVFGSAERQSWGPKSENKHCLDDIKS
ncbi:sialin-like isoform X1 [Argiope bruennichi]|uniref:sialin-like isoform X1 n=1 Tax=Argiope bruennichi TaxID=94029 RepID=UPI002493D686|nr:sialin-like isoform X1 [Argiope bruennichi]